MAVPHLLVARQTYSPVSRGYTESMSREMYPKSYVVLTREPVAKGCPLKNQSMRIVGSDLGSSRQSKCTLPPSGTLRLSWMRNYVLNQNLFITGSISTFSTLLNFFFFFYLFREICFQKPRDIMVVLNSVYGRRAEIYKRDYDLLQ